MPTRQRKTDSLLAHPWRIHVCAAAVMLGFAAIRLWIAASGQLDLAQDEAQYWDWSRRPQLSYYSKGPLIAWIIGAGTRLFGDTELGVRFFACIGNLGVQVLLYSLLAGLMRRPLLGLLTVGIANTTPLFIASGVLMTTDNPLLLCWMGGFVCLACFGEYPGKRWPLWGMTLSVCFGVLAKYTMLVFIPLAVAYALILRRKGMIPRGAAFRLTVWVSVGVALGLLPILLWNIQNDFVSFRHVARLAGVAPAPGEIRPWVTLSRFPEYLGSQAGLLLPWWLGIMLWHGWGLLRHVVCRLLKGTKDPVPAREWRLYLLLCLGFWPVWLFFIVWSFHTRIYPNWSAMSYATGLVIAALGVERLLPGKGGVTVPEAEAHTGITVSRPSIGKRLLPLWVALSIVVCCGIHGQKLLSEVLPLPPSLNPAVRLKGWSDLGERLDALRRSMPHPDRVFFFSDAYDVTAALNFYLPGHPVAYCADFGRRLSQYDLWPDPNGNTILGEEGEAGSGTGAASPRSGWDAVFVTRTPMKRVPAMLSRMFGGREEPQVFVAERDGRPGRSFGFLVLHGYTGVWPRAGQGKY